MKAWVGAPLKSSFSGGMVSVRGRSLLGQLYGDSGYRFHGFLAVKRGLMDLRVAFYLYVNGMIIAVIYSLTVSRSISKSKRFR